MLKREEVTSVGIQGAPLALNVSFLQMILCYFLKYLSKGDLGERFSAKVL